MRTKIWEQCRVPLHSRSSSSPSTWRQTPGRTRAWPLPPGALLLLSQRLLPLHLRTFLLFKVFCKIFFSSLFFSFSFFFYKLICFQFHLVDASVFS